MKRRTNERAVKQLRALADHLAIRPELPAPIGITPGSHGYPMRADVLDTAVRAWIESATAVGPHRIDAHGDRWHYRGHLILDDLDLDIAAVADRPMSRQAFALLVGTDYATPTRKAV